MPLTPRREPPPARRLSRRPGFAPSWSISSNGSCRWAIGSSTTRIVTARFGRARRAARMTRACNESGRPTGSTRWSTPAASPAAARASETIAREVWRRTLARSTTTAPAAVRSPPVASRWNSGAPTSASRMSSTRRTEARVTPSWRAAPWIEPQATIFSRMSRRAVSIVLRRGCSTEREPPGELVYQPPRGQRCRKSPRFRTPRDAHRSARQAPPRCRCCRRSRTGPRRGPPGARRRGNGPPHPAGRWAARARSCW